MSGLYKLVIVEDDAEFREIYKEYFEGHELILYGDAQSAIDNLDSDMPDCIIMDVSLPDMSGLDACKQIKENEDYFRIPIIFISGMNTLEDRLEGYLAGADDYITKPGEPEELKARVQVAVKNKQMVEEIQADANEIWESALEAMSSAGELGALLLAIEKCILCNTYDALSKEVFSAVESFELTCSMQIRPPSGFFFFSTGLVPEKEQIENELLTRVKNQGRFFDFGARTVVNFEHISLLIKNMPLDDPERYGRIKDNIAPFLSSANSRIQAIYLQQEVEKQKVCLKKLVEETQVAIEYIEKRYDEHKESSSELMERLIQEMDAGFLTLDLTEAQEKYFLQLLKTNKQKILDLYEGGLQIDDSFEKIMRKIKRTLETSTTG